MKNEFFNNQSGMVQVPEAMLAQMYADIHELVHMHRALIALYEEEAELKRRHRAYLHVRDHADEVCKEDKRRIAEIREHYDATEKQAAEPDMPEVFGVLLFPCEEDCSECEFLNTGNRDEGVKAVDDFFHMLMDVLMDEVKKQKKE